MKMLRRSGQQLALMATVLVLSACSSDSSRTPPVDPELSLEEQLRIVVDRAVDNGLPGVSLHVQNGTEHISVVAGVANQETGQPVTSSSLLQAGSIGKTFTATLILRLVDMGNLQLDDAIDLWLDPSLSAMIADSDRITVRMLLAHTSGIEDYFSVPEFLSAFTEAPGKAWSPMEIVGYIDNTGNLFEPGAAYSYSNTNTVLAGVIAERITGMSLGMALRQWVIDPAGLENTYGSLEERGQPDTMRSYVPVGFYENILDDIELPTDGSDLDTTVWVNSEGHGDASVHSTPHDLNAFIRLLIDTDTLVSDALKAQMMTGSFPGASQHGLGLFITDNGSRFGHDGKGFGLHTRMIYSPSEDLSYAATVNGSFGHYDDLYGEFLHQLASVFAHRQ